MLLLRIGWILGFVSTHEYHSQTRVRRFGADVPAATDASLERMERALVADRLAFVLFLIGTVILVYTCIHGPVLT
jgi:hypothetical protein